MLETLALLFPTPTCLSSASTAVQELPPSGGIHHSLPLTPQSCLQLSYWTFLCHGLPEHTGHPPYVQPETAGHRFFPKTEIPVCVPALSALWLRGASHWPLDPNVFLWSSLCSGVLRHHLCTAWDVCRPLLSSFWPYWASEILHSVCNVHSSL